ncbi:MAG: hypothetical protein JWN17_1879 [Frankiales bacterium]|nr:hypothetical protein [Frankiales bacterium]
MLSLPNGTHLDGDAEAVYLAFDDEEAGDDGVFAADLADPSGVPLVRVQAVLEDLVAQEVLRRSELVDPDFGPRYKRSRSA